MWQQAQDIVSLVSIGLLIFLISQSDTALHKFWISENKQSLFFYQNQYFIFDSGYPHDGRADKNPYPHDRRADKDSYPQDSNNRCIILRLQLFFVMINVQLTLV